MRNRRKQKTKHQDLNWEIDSEALFTFLKCFKEKWKKNPKATMTATTVANAHVGVSAKDRSSLPSVPSISPVQTHKPQTKSPSGCLIFRRFNTQKEKKTRLASATDSSFFLSYFLLLLQLAMGYSDAELNGSHEWHHLEAWNRPIKN